MIALETLGRFGPLERLELYFERHLERRLDAVLLQQVHNHLSQPSQCASAARACANSSLWDPLGLLHASVLSASS